MPFNPKKDKSILNYKEDLFYFSITEKYNIEKELEVKSDDLLVEDLYYAIEKMNLPDDLLKILKKYGNSRRLYPRERIKLRNYFRLIYSNEVWEE